MTLAALLASSLLSLAVRPPSAPTPVTPVFALSSCGDCRQAPVLVAGSSAGTFTAQWSAFETFTAFFRTFDARGNGGPESQLTPGSPSQAAGVGSAGDGSFVLLWQNPGQIYAQRLDSGGSASGERIHVNADHLSGGDDEAPFLAVAANGGFLVTWQGNQGSSFTSPVFARRVDAGNGLQPQVELGTTVIRSSAPACFTGQEASVVAWPLPLGTGSDAKPSGIAFRLLAADGAAGPAVVVLQPSEKVEDRGLALACAPGGGFAIAWHTRRQPARDGFDVAVQRFGARGERVGKPLRMNAALKGDQTSPALLFERDGRLLVVWASTLGGREEIRGRRLSRQGRPAGPEFVLHQAQDGLHIEQPAVASIGEQGELVVTWSEGDRAFARIFQP